MKNRKPDPGVRFTERGCQQMPIKETPRQKPSASPIRRAFGLMLSASVFAAAALAAGEGAIEAPAVPEQEVDVGGVSEPSEGDEWVRIFPVAIQEDVLALRDFFETRLPDALDQYDLSLDYTPKFGDFVNRDYLRFPITLWYGLTDRTDLLLGLSPFTPNPFRSGDESGWGLGALGTGVRHTLPAPVYPFDQTLVSFDIEVPFGRPPPGVADHFGRLRPSIVSLRRLDTLPHSYFLLGLTHDQAFETPFRSTNGSFPRIHWTSLSPGLIHKPGNVGYLAEYTLRLIDEERDLRWAHIYTAGLFWELPARRAPRYLPGDWRFDMAYRFTDEQGREVDHSISLRVSVRFYFRQFLRDVTED